MSLKSKMPLQVWILTLSAFAIGTAEFVIAGVLPQVAGSLGISEGQAGNLITAYALAIVVGTLPRDWRRQVEALDCAMLHADQRRLDRPTVEVVRDAGLPLFAYTVNLPQRARELFSWGVDAVFSDCPDRVAEGLAGEAI